MRILAKASSFNDDGYSTLLAFADDKYDPVSYLMLGMVNQPDEQDLKLRLGGIHIEAGAPYINGYDLVEDIRETNTGIVVSLRADAAEKAGINQDIEIEIESKIIEGIPASEAVRRFKERLSLWEESKAKMKAR